MGYSQVLQLWTVFVKCLYVRHQTNIKIVHETTYTTYIMVTDYLFTKTIHVISDFLNGLSLDFTAVTAFSAALFWMSSKDEYSFFCKSVFLFQIG